MRNMDQCEPEGLADGQLPEIARLAVRRAGRVVLLDPDGRVLLLAVAEIDQATP